MEFQSTPLIRGETGVHRMIGVDYSISIHSPHTRGDPPRLMKTLRCWHFNPLPSYEGRQGGAGGYQPPTDFNPLPSYEGRPAGYFFCPRQYRFQSTPLIRGETISPAPPIRHM